MRAALRRLFGRTVTERHPLIQATVNNGCSFESCGEPWDGQEWHGWRLCPSHYAQTAQRGEVRTPSFV